MKSTVEVVEQEAPEPRLPLGWMTGVAIGALAVMGLAIGSLQAAGPTASIATEGSAIAAVLVPPPLDHSVVQSIDASGEPDLTGASVATYGP